MKLWSINCLLLFVKAYQDSPSLVKKIHYSIDSKLFEVPLAIVDHQGIETMDI